MKTTFQPLGVWRAFGCNSMGLVVDKGRQVLLSGQVAWDDLPESDYDGVTDG